MVCGLWFQIRELRAGSVCMLESVSSSRMKASTARTTTAPIARLCKV